jgi:hypothetical protein
MSARVNVRNAPIRLVSGAFILNSGITKLSADEQAAAGMHGMAAGAYPFLRGVEPPKFAKLLAASEITVGAALLLPVVPRFVAGAALTGFSAGLLGLYLRTPGMRRDGDIRPTPDGTALAKDVWMFGIGSSLLVDALLARRERRARRRAKQDDPFDQ